MVRRIADRTVRDYYAAQFKAELERAFDGGAAVAGAGRGQARQAPGRADARLAARHGLHGGEALRRQRLLIACLLNHPELIHHVFEEVAELRLSSAPLDKIRLAILEQASSGAPLDLDGLKTNLINSGIVPLIEELTGPGTAKLDPLARPDAPLAQVRQDWTSVFRLHRLNDLHHDLTAAQESLGREMTDENMARFTLAQQAFERAKAEAADTGQS